MYIHRLTYYPPMLAYLLTPENETTLFLYGFSTDSLRICGRFAHNICMPQKESQIGAGSSKPSVRQIHCY